ncbi:uncharacterized protein METZ01_LOCUS230258, partial [marine metagenome]
VAHGTSISSDSPAAESPLKEHPQLKITCVRAIPVS